MLIYHGQRDRALDGGDELTDAQRTMHHVRPRACWSRSRCVRDEHRLGIAVKVHELAQRSRCVLLQRILIEHDQGDVSARRIMARMRPRLSDRPCANRVVPDVP